MAEAEPDQSTNASRAPARSNPNRPSTIHDHPSLLPAFHLTVKIGAALPVGSLSRGQPLTVVPLISGTLRSEPGFPIEVDARMIGQGSDYVHNDPDGGRMRLRSDLVVEDEDGELLQIHYSGIIDINNEMRRILGRSPNATSTDFGSSFTNVRFETGSMRYKSLEQGLFVGAGRFILDVHGLSAEYRISKVVRGVGGPP